MDPNRFDDLMRSLRQPRTRRGAVAAVLAGLLGPVVPVAEGKRGKERSNGKDKRKRGGADRGQGKGRGRKGVRTQQLPANCCSTGNCTPGKGKNLQKCCYEDGNVSGKNFSGANLGSANFTRADASDANFGGANLGKACLVDADLTRATINGSTNTGGTVFCRTVMPDGSTNNSGCNRGTTCCPTCIAEGQVCGAGIGGACCARFACVDGRCRNVCDVCASGCAFATLGPAVDAADEGAAIRLCPGTYPTIGVIIGKNLTIFGAGDGPEGTILDGERETTVVEIERGVAATIRDLTVTRGAQSGIEVGPPGGLNTGSALTLERVRVVDNANEGGGGGIFVSGGAALVLRSSAVTDNAVGEEGLGGGIFNEGTTTLDASRVSENRAPGGEGGGIFTFNGGNLTLINRSRVTGNSAGSAGGVLNRGTVAVDASSAIAGNDPDNCVDDGPGTGCPA